VETEGRVLLCATNFIANRSLLRPRHILALALAVTRIGRPKRCHTFQCSNAGKFGLLLSSLSSLMRFIHSY
jgi:hypothetical protein